MKVFSGLLHQIIGTGPFCDCSRCLSVRLATEVTLKRQARTDEEITFDAAAAPLSSARVPRRSVKLLHGSEAKCDRSL
jgi:hypothetical protein